MRLRKATDYDTTSARFVIFENVGSGATWSRTLVLDDAGAVISGATTSDWMLTLRPDSQSAAILTLTDGAGLTITNNAASTNIVILVTNEDMAAVEPGDYVADLSANTTGGAVTLWAHGTVVARDEPTDW